MNGPGQKIWTCLCYALTAALTLFPLGVQAGSPMFQSFNPSYSFTGFVRDVAFGDVNADGNSDAVLLMSDRVIVLHGNGDGTFPSTATAEYPLGGSPRKVAIADFNRDGIGDVATTNYSAHVVTVFLGSGDDLVQQPDLYLGAASGPDGIVAADLDGDGFTDLAVAANDRSALVALYGNGDGTFGAPVSYSVGAYPSYLTIADFNGDSLPDVAVSNDGGSDISILLNAGAGGGSLFLGGVRVGAGIGTPAELVSGDFNEDGNADLAVAENSPSMGSVAVLLGNGDGSFESAAHYGNLSISSDIAMGDFDDDGHLDLAVIVNNQTEFLSGDGTGTFSIVDVLPFGGNISAGDANDDGLTDLAIFSLGNVQLRISKAEGEMAFSESEYLVPEDAGTASVTVQRNGGSYGQTKLRIRTADGTAIAGADYAAVDETIVFHPGETTKTYAIPIFDDAVVASDRSFSVEISNATNGAILGAVTSAIVTIQENDALSTNANLGGLELSSSALSPAFAAATTSYSASVANGTASLTVTPTAVDGGAEIEVAVNGGAYAPVASGVPSVLLPLRVGANAIDIRVTAEDGTTTKTYRIDVTRASSGGGGGGGTSLSSNNALKSFSLTLADGQELPLTPTFDQTVLHYEAETEADRLELRFDAEHSSSTVILNGQAVKGVVTVELQEGENTLELTVKAEDGTTRSFTFLVHRRSAQPEQPQLPQRPSCTFADISDHWAKGPICEAAAKGIIEGDSLSAFRPEGQVTRVEFAVMLARALGLSPAVSANSLSFVDDGDIPAWARGYVRAAVERGLLNGYTDGSIRPRQAINRAEMAAMLAKAMKWEPDESRTAFADEGEWPAWAKDYVQSAVRQGVLVGRPDNRFDPYAPTTRAEAVTALVRLDL
ncbi:hypothetical protein B1A99_02495 [Cohnella sp. CIP 111063]|uniref:FG-GAP-like repeat-containing protein n=1 Tax=unclassified Cohnella TaxID=2636738 RepID=UPI000B8BF393|nr:MULTISPECIES: FG-GAP-like repeat-containing protein [unclassified Cohnella]OXS62743.1 hypothetical protein B1A99_02495 [Cohnella sp. CIP 111063]PRX75016.1 cadherin-like protein [Cohnella sp. SGD-V74]